MEKSNTIFSDLICSECGNTFTIPRFTNNLREKYHIKDIYCINCRYVTKHIEVRNLDIIKKELEFKDELSETEQLIYNLTHKKEKSKKL